MCGFEFFHHAPSLAMLREVDRKHLTWQHQRARNGAKEMSTLWVVCASRPGKALRATPETLTPRRMGRGAVLRAAMQEFDRTPKGAPERALAAAVVDFMERRRTETVMSERADYLRRRAQELFDEARLAGEQRGRDAGRHEGA